MRFLCQDNTSREKRCVQKVVVHCETVRLVTPSGMATTSNKATFLRGRYLSIMTTGDVLLHLTHPSSVNDEYPVDCAPQVGYTFK